MKKLILLYLILFMGALHSQTTQNEHHSMVDTNLKFIKNNCQWHKDVRFKMSIGSNTIFLEEEGFTFKLRSAGYFEKIHDYLHEAQVENSEINLVSHSYKVNFINSKVADLTGGNQSKEHYNYYIGNDTTKWANKVPVYKTVNYEELYQGIDMNVYSSMGNFKYDFIIAPNINPEEIKLEYSGLDNIFILEGDLVLETSIGQVVEKAPYAYQIINNEKIQVPCKYKLTNTYVTYEFPEGWDESKTLIIDPTVIAATLSGSSVQCYGYGATYDSEGNIYANGIGFDDGYPVTIGAASETYSGNVDMVFSKFSPDGTTLLFGTFLGGAVGADRPHSTVVSASNELYIYGNSKSSDYPTTVGVYDTGFNGGSDIVITKLSSSTGAMIASTFVGGSVDDGLYYYASPFLMGRTYQGELILDESDNVYVSSVTNSTNFPTAGNPYQGIFGGDQDGVLFSLNSDLSSLVWSTYVGGVEADGCYGIHLDSAGDIYTCGRTKNDFLPFAGAMPSYSGNFDGFVMKFSGGGSVLEASTYWGTSNSDETYFIDLDSEENVYIFGTSAHGGSPVIGNVYVDPGSAQYIAKLDPDLETILVSTVVGSGIDVSEDELDFQPSAFLVDECGYIYWCGHSSLVSMPVTADALYQDGNFYIGKLSPDAVSLEMATFYPGEHAHNGMSHFSKQGVIYQSVCTATPFPTTNGAWSSVLAPDHDLGVFKIDFSAGNIGALIAQVSPFPSVIGCSPFEVSFDNLGGGIDYEWDFDDGSPINTQFEPTHIFTNPGVYNVQFIAIDPNSCIIADTLEIVITVLSDLEFDIGNDTIVCNESLILDVEISGVTYLWQDGSVEQTFVVTESGEYFVEVSTDNCISFDTIVVTLSGASVDLGEDIISCDASIILNAGNEGDSYVWQDGSTNQLLTVTQSGEYYVDVVYEGCITSDTIEVIINELTVDLGPDIITCDTDLVIDAGNNVAGVSYLWQDGSVNQFLTVNESGAYNIEITDEFCIAYDTIEIILNELDVDLGPDITICNPVQLDAANEGNSYIWQDGSINQTLLVSVPGDYWVIVIDANDCSSSDTISVFQGEINVDLGPDLIGCTNLIELLDAENAGSLFLWNNGSVNQTMNINELGTYWVEVTDGICVGSDTVIVDYSIPLAFFIVDDTIGCYPLNVIFTDQSITYQGTIVEWLWGFDDGQFSNDQNPIHNYATSGIYNVELVVTTDEGCSNSYGNIVEIEIFEQPIALFSVESLPVIIDQEVVFINESINSNTFNWNFGDGINSYLQDPTHIFTELNSFNVTLISSNNECKDSITILIPVSDELLFFVPNAFTPDQNKFNNTFKPIFTSGFDPYDYHLMIFNRWGELIFESYNSEIGWNGVYTEQGSLAQDGVYVWRIEFKETMSDKHYAEEGHVVLIK